MNNRLKFLRSPFFLLFLIQLFFGLRVLLRMGRSAGGEQVTTVAIDERQSRGLISVIVPVLNEVSRLSTCLEGLIQQGSVVQEILVVDGGSTDGTQDLVRSFVNTDPRVRLIDASPVPERWNGKAWGLQTGLEAASDKSVWLLCVDADVFPAPELANSLFMFASERDHRVMSVATRQMIDSRSEGVLHPAMLTTLVYRFGIPGGEYRSANDVQANGQCFFARRDLIERIGGFTTVRNTICEDIALARQIVNSGEPVGFYEAGDLISVRMYQDWRETWREWPRSLPMRDGYSGPGWIGGLAEVITVQALPLPLMTLHLFSGSLRLPRWLVFLNLNLLATRFGVLMGTRRAYVQTPWTYWLSPLADLPVAFKLLVNSFRRSYQWRGRQVVRKD